MSKQSQKSKIDSADALLFSDQDIDLDEFVNDMEEQTLRDASRKEASRAARQRLEDRAEQRRLRDLLDDWSDTFDIDELS